LAGAAALLLAACATPTRPPAAPRAAAVPLDGSYDWHVLVPAPFGSVIKDVPLRLHEVLLFNEREAVSAKEAGECYAPDAEPPRFAKRAPEAYSLCFLHDHLARIEVTVWLGPEEAAQVLNDACTLWLRHAAQPAAPLSGRCEGREDATRFEAALGEAEEGGEIPFTVRLEGLEP
jgi:hypothetical protein